MDTRSVAGRLCTLLFILGFLAGCMGPPHLASPEEEEGVGTEQVTGGDLAVLDPAAIHEEIALLPAGDLSNEEAADMMFLREEEKLARDLYSGYYTRWESPLFLHIAEAEQTHTEAVGVLIDRYNLTGSPPGDRGVFRDPVLQEEYHRLAEEGNTSVPAALRSGAYVEETSIWDLDKALSTTEKLDLIMVYARLRAGSAQHLRIYVHQIELRGEDYTPQVLPVDTYEEIVERYGMMGPA